jgi:hypothetical protein
LKVIIMRIAVPSLRYDENNPPRRDYRKRQHIAIRITWSRVPPRILRPTGAQLHNPGPSDVLGEGFGAGSEGRINWQGIFRPFRSA